MFTAQHAKTWLLWLILIECCFAVVYVVSSLLGEPITILHKLFDLNIEATIPAWFSSTQLFVIACLLFSFSRSRAPLQGVSKWLFAVLGAGFLFLSMDEASAIHEKVNRVLQRYEWAPRFKDDRGLWIPMYLAIGTLCVVAMRRDLLAVWRHYRREARVILWGGGLYAFGAMVLELIMIEWFRGTSTPFVHELEIVAEEMSEMVGASLILYGVLLLALRLWNPGQRSQPTAD